MGKQNTQTQARNANTNPNPAPAEPPPVSQAKPDKPVEAKPAAPAIASQPRRAPRVVGVSPRVPGPIVSTDQVQRRLEALRDEIRQLDADAKATREEVARREEALVQAEELIAQREEKIGEEIDVAVSNLWRPMAEGVLADVSSLVEELGDPKSIELANQAIADASLFAAQAAMAGGNEEAKKRAEANLAHAWNTLESLEAEARAKIAKAVAEAFQRRLEQAVQVGVLVLRSAIVAA